ncbi:CDP-glycerol glycerophosphotransferase family protein, partial [Microvirga sp. 3-52]|nr:CDP-glycerol glycerophosphotransferase family protein [Microvirga sp. 3-52]
PGSTRKTYKEDILKESKNWSYLISPNNYSSGIFRSAFGFNGVMIESGYPRNDKLYTASETEVADIKETLKIPKDKKIILYAPTWRDDDYFKVGQYKFTFQFELDKMKERFGDE